MIAAMEITEDTPMTMPSTVNGNAPWTSAASP